MLPTKKDAFTPASTTDYLALAAREPTLPPTLSDFLALLGPAAKTQQEARHAALSTCIRHLQAGVPESASIQLWLLVTYAPALQAMATRFRTTGSSLAESESAAVWAFLETLLKLREERLVDPCMALELVRDTRRHLVVQLGLRDYQQAGAIDVAQDDRLMEDRLPDDHADAYQALQDMIRDMPVTEAERTLLGGLYVYNYTLQEMATQMGEAYETLKKRHQRVIARLREKGLKKS